MFSVGSHSNFFLRREECVTVTSNDHRITVFSGTRVGHSATLACLAGDIRLLNPPPQFPGPLLS